MTWLALAMPCMAALIMLSLQRAKKAPVTRDIRKWASKPNRLDLGGFDRPGAKDHI